MSFFLFPHDTGRSLSFCHTFQYLKKAKKENCIYIPDLNDLERKLDKIIEPNDLFITIGAGTIWRYSDSYAQHLNQQYNYS